jgi:integrase
MRTDSNAYTKKITWVADGIGYRVLTDRRSRSYCIDYSDAAGTRVRSFKDPETGAPLRRELDAREALSRVIVRRADGVELRKSTVTLTALAEEWLARQISVSPGTKEGWERNLRLHVLPTLGRLQVAKINEQHLRNLMLAARNAGKSESTIANIVQPLRMILDEAVIQRLVGLNPWVRVPKKEKPKPSATRAKRRVLTIDEIDQLVAGAAAVTSGDSVRMQALVSVFVYSGLRKSEALGLVWGNVDFNTGLLRVERQLSRDGSMRVLPKTAASVREIPLSRELRQMLMAWKMKSRFSQPDDYVFATATGTPIGQRNAHRMITALALSLGLNSEPEDPKRPNLDVHSLRHVFASAMIRVTKGDAESVAALTGHGDTDVLMKVYSHEFEAVRGGQTVAARAAMIDAAFDGNL